MRVLRFAFEEAVTSLKRGRQSGLLATGTIAVAIFVLGGFLLVLMNLERMSAEWSRSVEVSVYLDDDVTATERGEVERLLDRGGVVAGAEFVSKEEARRRFQQVFADLGPAIDALESNPLPASYEIRLRPSAAGAALEAMVESLRQSAGVSDVRYDRQWLDRLLSVVSTVSSVGLIVGALLTCGAALTVANVVRLALYARRDEIAIMQLVGAPRAFVRGPFVMEGILQGGLGAIVALAALQGIFLAVSTRYLAPLAAAVNLSSFRFLPIELCVVLLVGGMAVGCLGGAVATAGRT